MSHRHSCERCRQQKVRCLRDSQVSQEPSPGQSIPQCSRCAKAGTACIYSLRVKTRRPGSTVDGGQPAISQSSTPSIKNPSIPFSSMDEYESLYQVDFDGFNWGQPPLFSSMQSSMTKQVEMDLSMTNHTTAQTSGTHSDGQWCIDTPSMLYSSPNPEFYRETIAAADSFQELMSQATVVSAQAASATRLLLHPESTPPTVSSAHVNEAFEGTKTLVRIIYEIMSIASPNDSGYELEAVRCDGGCRSADIGALVLTTLACHQHLLAFFKAICDSIERFVESAGDAKRFSQVGSSLHGDGLPSTAQFTMVLQLLVHLINRLDRCLFPTRPSSPVSSSSASACGGSGMDILVSRHDSDDVMPDTAGIPSLAHALVRAMPGEHVRLRQAILQLQARMETLEAF
ncbi:hypothetical protein DDE82_002269 [Stemphylium lycopersici]|nr:hypothetical protein TW65_05241 [Stemphylium lycopersici]RAR08650.1 hypothetical protein DDE82_002269 [Stemphylium lycopersici]